MMREEIINKEWWCEKAKECLDKAKECLECEQQGVKEAEYWSAQAKECIAQVVYYD